jgi:hypothetical protein
MTRKLNPQKRKEMEELRIKLTRAAIIFRRNGHKVNAKIAEGFIKNMPSNMNSQGIQNMKLIINHAEKLVTEN